MEKSKKILNGLPYNLVQSFFSTNTYCVKGYMVDWIVNGANLLGISKLKIDLIRNQVEPKEMMIHPLTFEPPYLIPIIERELKSNGIPTDYIKEAIFEIRVSNDREMVCSSYVVGEDGRVFKGKDYKEKSSIEFDPFELEPKGNSVNKSTLIKGLRSILKKI